MASGIVSPSKDGGSAHPKLLALSSPRSQRATYTAGPDRRAIAKERAAQTIRFYTEEHPPLTLFKLLHNVRDLVHAPYHWTQRGPARYGRFQAWSCEPDSPLATCWDLSGAIFHEAPEDWHNLVRYDALMLLGKLAKMPVLFFNDNRTHAQVLNLLDEAILEAARESL